jgi:hypothetical protein
MVLGFDCLQLLVGMHIAVLCSWFGFFHIFFGIAAVSNADFDCHVIGLIF